MVLCSFLLTLVSYPLANKLITVDSSILLLWPPYVWEKESVSRSIYSALLQRVYTAVSRNVVGKKRTRQARKVILPTIPFGIVECAFFRQPFSKQLGTGLCTYQACHPFTKLLCYFLYSCILEKEHSF